MVIINIIINLIHQSKSRILLLSRNKRPYFKPKETLVFLKREENIKLKMENKPLEEITNNEADSKLFKFIKPLSEVLAKGILYISAKAPIVTFFSLFNNICNSQAEIVRSYTPSKEFYIKLSSFEKLKLEKLWIVNNIRFKLLAAPFLVISLYVALTSTISIYIENTETELPNKSISLLAFFKKLPNLIGKIVILTYITSIIKYFLNIYSINLMDPFYIKIFCVSGIIINSVICLDNLLKLWICRFFKKNKKLSISKNLPKIIYEYLSTLKLFSRHKISGVFLINFSIYFFISLLLIFILILI